jgi:apolipoprotein N-acyltransferase
VGLSALNAGIAQAEEVCPAWYSFISGLNIAIFYIPPMDKTKNILLAVGLSFVFASFFGCASKKAMETKTTEEKVREVRIVEENVDQALDE